MYIELSMNGINFINKKLKTVRSNKGKSLITFPNTYYVIDLETTGLDPSYDDIIEMAAIEVIDGKIISEYSSLVNPGYKLDSFIIELTGITNEMLRNAPDLNKVLPEFLKYIKDNIVVGHNVNFDVNFIYDNCMMLLNKSFNNNFIDTMRLSRKILPNLKHHRLIDLSNHYNLNYQKAHRALNDCIITNTCFKYLYNDAITQYGSEELFVKNCFKNQKKSNRTINTKTKKKLSEITTINTEFDTSHMLYGKTCVFTGVLDKMTRNQAAQFVVDLGGICKNTITKTTNYLILGNTAYAKSIKNGQSNKLKKAKELISLGADLEIITENIFYELISQ